MKVWDEDIEIACDGDFAAKVRGWENSPRKKLALGVAYLAGTSRPNDLRDVQEIIERLEEEKN